MECTDKKHPEHICSLTARGEIDLVHTLALHPAFRVRQLWREG